MFGLQKTYKLSLSFQIDSPSLSTIQSILRVVRSIPLFDYISADMKVTESKGWTTVRSSSMSFRTREGVLEALEKYAERSQKEKESKLQ